MTAFLPTHRVPPTGIDSWPRPDPQAPRGPRIEGGLELQVVERLGDWAKVTFSNGWSAWVDGRTLVGHGPGASSPHAVAAAHPGAATVSHSGSSFDLQALLADRTKASALGGALLVALASLLPWLRGGGASSNSFDVPVQFLFDYKTASDGIKLGWLLLIVAAAIIVVVVKGADPRITRGAGIVAIAVAALYVVQLQRLVSSADGASLTDFVGVGVLVAAVGGLLATFAPQIGARKR
jgi:hypothetical protein